MTTWVNIQNLVADPGSIYRCFWCENCQSIRYHKVNRLKITKVDKEWWVFFERICAGLPPVIYGKRPRLIKDCGVNTREWMSASQWNWLVKVNAYAA